MDSVVDLLDNHSPKAKQPNEISMELKPHQLSSLYRMKMLDRNCGMVAKLSGIEVHSNVGILADLSGYGKTITFLALIESLKDKELLWLPKMQTFINGGYGISLLKKRNTQNIKTNLIVVPDNLVDHWQLHIEEFTELVYETVSTGIYNKIIIEDYDIILCPASHYNKFVRENCEYYWNRVAFDEADSIPIPNTEYVNTRFLWLITATYDNMPKRKNKGFLKDLFKSNRWDDLMKQYFLPVVIKGDDNYVKNSFDLPEPIINYVECITPHFVNVVREHINPQVLDLISAGDLDGAILALGGNVDTDRNIIDLVTKKTKNKVLTLESKLQTLKLLEISEPERLIKQNKWQQKLSSLKSRIENIEKSIKEIPNNVCIICTDQIKHPTLTPCCNKIYCAECLLEWLKTGGTCPTCRTNFELSQLQTISSTTRSPVILKKDKTMTLLDIVKGGNGQYIIFSGYKATLYEISVVLSYNKINYSILNRTHNLRVVHDLFRKREISVILLHAEYNGAGIEIPEATDIILYHQMRGSLEKQAIARAQRPGRESPLRIWKLKYAHEYIK